MINYTVSFTETGLAVIYYVIYPMSLSYVDNITIQFATDGQQGYASLIVKYIRITFLLQTSYQDTSRRRTAC